MSVEVPAIAVRRNSRNWRNWRIRAVGVLLALGFFSLPVGSWVHDEAGLVNRLEYELIVWAWVVGMMLYVVRVERRPLSSIGFRALGLKDGILAIVAGILILASLAFMLLVVFPALHWSESSQIASISRLPYWLNVLIVVRAAVSEEILFRGYPIERLEELTGSRAVAGVVTCAVFTLDHISFWGWHHMFIAGLAGAALTILYLWRRNIRVNMIAHFIVDASAFLA
jgi:membrane protease YdiL (CAAX protease family)